MQERHAEGRSRLGQSDPACQQFVSARVRGRQISFWQDSPRATAGTPAGSWVIDETSFSKAGAATAVGGQRQYGGAPGKKANFQSVVSLAPRQRRTRPQPAALLATLYLPEGAGPGDPSRRQRAGIPRAAQAISLWLNSSVASGPARWRVEQDYLELQGGTGPWMTSRGRSWQGFHHIMSP